MTYRAPIVGNRILDAAWNERQLQHHNARLSDIKPIIDIKPPESYHVSLNRSKREQLHQIEYDRIDKENALLLKKMTHIIRNNTQSYNVIHPDYSHSLNSHIRRKELY